MKKPILIFCILLLSAGLSAQNKTKIKFQEVMVDTLSRNNKSGVGVVYFRDTVAVAVIKSPTNHTGAIGLDSFRWLLGYIDSVYVRSGVIDSLTIRWNGGSARFTSYGISLATGQVIMINNGTGGSSIKWNTAFDRSEKIVADTSAWNDATIGFTGVIDYKNQAGANYWLGVTNGRIVSKNSGTPP